MLTKNLTPFLFGAKLCSRKPPQPEMTLVVRGKFVLSPGVAVTPLGDLEQGMLTAEVFHEDDDERQGECVYPGDFADFKLNAEVLLKGTCNAPGQKAVTESSVRFAVGAWSKSLKVTGPRAWTDDLPGAQISSPLPFTTMPLTYTNSFGGPGFALNPVGKGHGNRDLPNIEHAAHLVRSRGDRPEPAGFGPLNAAWPQRAGKVGKEYGKSYQEKRAPYFAEDFDWAYFSAAPLDQQISGYLRGDEELTFQNLHPHAPVFSARLPGLRVRAFVKDVERRFREVRLSLDTLLADTDEGVLTLTWRGVDKVKEDDLTDVAFVLLATEPLQDRALPESHYQTLLEELEQDPMGFKAAMPAGLEEAGERLQEERAGRLPAAPAVAPPDPVSGMMQAKFGNLAGPEQSRVGDAIARTKIASPKTDLDGALAAAISRLAESPPMAMPRKPGAMPDLGLRASMRELLAKVAQVKQIAVDQKTPLKEAELARLQQLEQVPNDPRWKQLDPEYRPPGPISTDEPGPGRDLSEQDLSHRDLRGLDLSNARMEGTILTGADLRGAKLCGASLKNAILYKADLSGADLSKADLTTANAALVRADGVNLTGAILEQAFFEGAILTNAILIEAKGEYVVFAAADMTGARAERASLEHSDFSKATLTRASFFKASLGSCLFAECHAAHVDMTSTKLRGVSFADANLKGARFLHARGEQSLWAKARLDGADFSYAWMVGSHFNEVSATDARFFGANLRECRFYKASLERAEMVRANLFGADLCKATMTGAKFTGASLYDAKFLQASGAGCDFNGANLKRSTLERA